MKELILFSAALIFIFCQDLQSSDLPLKMKSKVESQTFISEVANDESSCEIETKEPMPSFDVVKELSSSENPGIYYREVVLRSEPEFDRLYCISGVSSDADMDETASLAATEEPKDELIENHQEQDSNLEAWNFLTDKWTITQEKVFCEDQNRFKLNPACEDSIQLFEEPYELNSDVDQSLANL